MARLGKERSGSGQRGNRDPGKEDYTAILLNFNNALALTVISIV